MVLIALVSCQQNTQKVTHNYTTGDASQKNVADTSKTTGSSLLRFYEKDTIIEGNEQMVYIKSISGKGSAKSITAEYIQFLMGDDAIKTAGENGDLDTTYNDDGTISFIGVPNDYYILSDDKKMHTLALAKNAVIETIYWGEAQYYLRKVAVDSFYHRFAVDSETLRTTPFNLTLRNDTVIKIEEVYVP